MCGIVGAVSARNIVPILVEGLKRLEYRGYDSCGVAVHQGGGLKRARSTSRVAELDAQVAAEHLDAGTGIAHTRWATHGAPAVANAHPHFSPGAHAPADAPGRIALVHNGIIENHDELRAELQAKGFVFTSQTDTEVIAHLVAHLYQGDLFEAVQQAVVRLKGAFAIAVFCRDEPHRVVGAREGSPLVLGVGSGEHGSETFLASDAMALAGVTDRIVYLEEGDVVDVQMGKHWIVGRSADGSLRPVDRPVRVVQAHSGAAELGPYRHYMQKEIFEQPKAIADTLDAVAGISPELFGDGAFSAFKGIDQVLILACGTSYYAGSVAKQWLESIAGIPTAVEIASEYRYRDSVPNPRTLVVTISQSGETADTMAALKHARALGMPTTLTVCNVATSAMVRECRHAFLTRAGVEVGVASTKAFTTQLVGLFLLALALAQVRGRLTPAQEAEHLKALRHLPTAVAAVLALEPQIVAWSQAFTSKEHALFLGRGLHYPVALEGALKLKEISYIHAEAYPAGPGDRGDAGRHRGAQRPAARKVEKQYAGGAGARRRALCVRRHRHAHRKQPRRARDPHAGELRRAVTDPACGAAAIARLSHGGGARHRRRQAAQPGQERDGRVRRVREIEVILLVEN
jgi:glucosamine--fructose-6-phosphate aminotransferase (isomerizing)